LACHFTYYQLRLQLGCFSLSAPGLLVLKSKPLTFDSLLLLYLAFYFCFLRLLRFLQSCSPVEFQFRPHRSRSRAHCCSQLNSSSSLELSAQLGSKTNPDGRFFRNLRFPTTDTSLNSRSSTKRTQVPLPACSTILFEGQLATIAKPVRGNGLSCQRG